MLDFLLPQKTAKKTIVDIKNDKIIDLTRQVKSAEEQAAYWRARFEGMKIETATLHEQIKQLSIENVRLLNRKGFKKFSLKNEDDYDLNNA